MSWESHEQGVYKRTKNSWLFSIDNKEKYEMIPGREKYAIFCQADFGPLFGGGPDIYLSNGCNING